MAERSAQQRQISGEDIVSEVVRNFDSGLFRLRYTTLAPCIYRVYLHTEDYDALRPVMRHLIAEVKRSLQERLDALNRAARPATLARKLGIGPAETMEYKVLEPAWLVDFYPDHEEKLQRGDIEVDSELGSSPREEFDSSTMTRVITRSDANGQTTRRLDSTAPQTNASGAEQAYARLRYQDDGGPQTFAVTKDQTVIGRGGKTFWVDVKVQTAPDVSREHCRLRRDPETGHFYLKDMSQFGTTVDGKRILSSIEIVGGTERDKNVEVALPERCTLGLADTLFLEFEMVAQP